MADPPRRNALRKGSARRRGNRAGAYAARRCIQPRLIFPKQFYKVAASREVAQNKNTEVLPKSNTSVFLYNSFERNEFKKEDFINIPMYVATYDDFVYAIKYKNGSTKICLSKKMAKVEF